MRADRNPTGAAFGSLFASEWFRTCSCSPSLTLRMCERERGVLGQRERRLGRCGRASRCELRSCRRGRCRRHSTFKKKSRVGEEGLCPAVPHHVPHVHHGIIDSIFKL